MWPRRPEGYRHNVKVLKFLIKLFFLGFESWGMHKDLEGEVIFFWIKLNQQRLQVREMLVVKEVTDLQQPFILAIVCTMDLPLPSVVDGQGKIVLYRLIGNVIVVAISHAITAKIKEFIKN